MKHWQLIGMIVLAAFLAGCKQSASSRAYQGDFYGSTRNAEIVQAAPADASLIGESRFHGSESDAIDTARWIGADFVLLQPQQDGSSLARFYRSKLMHGVPEVKQVRTPG